MEFTIDRSKWRCGNDGECGHGVGETSLLNNEGYMCCLGQVCLQLGVKESEIFGKYEPCDVSKEYKDKIDEILISTYPYTSNSKLTYKAMIINDNEDYNDDEREKLLEECFQEYGHNITFVNDYED